MDVEFKAFAEQTVRDFGLSYFDIRLRFVRPGLEIPVPVVGLPIGDRGHCVRIEIILIDESLPTGKQLTTLYHELGHLDYRRNATVPATLVDDEFHAHHYCLSRLEAEGRIELLRDQLNVIKAHLVAGNNKIDQYHPDAFAKVRACADWGRWAEMAANVPQR